MKWRWNRPPEPVIGDSRIIRRFAWWPIPCDDGYFRWLTMLKIEQRFQVRSEDHGEMHTHIYTRLVEEWVDYKVTG